MIPPTVLTVRAAHDGVRRLPLDAAAFPTALAINDRDEVLVEVRHVPAIVVGNCIRSFSSLRDRHIRAIGLTSTGAFLVADSSGRIAALSAKAGIGLVDSGGMFDPTCGDGRVFGGSNLRDGTRFAAIFGSGRLFEPEREESQISGYDARTGAFVGTRGTDGLLRRPTIWRNGRAASLPLPARIGSAIASSADAGDVLGAEMIVDSAHRKADSSGVTLLWRSGRPEILDDRPEFRGRRFTICALRSGALIGSITRRDRTERVFAWRDGRMRTLPPIEGFSSFTAVDASHQGSILVQAMSSRGIGIFVLHP